MGIVSAVGASRIVAAPEAPREISFFHIHTKETLTIVYKRDGKFIPEAMDKIDWLMRDWRKNESIKMDPKTIDILWEIHEELGSKEPIHIVCGYRSGSTNEMLRRTVGGQAKNSNHISGIAIDAYFPDVPPKFARYAGLVRERGGVGYYPTSALPFVHIDTGRVRHWPTIAHDELALLFPGGHSQHVPLGGSLRPGDYERAKQRNGQLATELASYDGLRNSPKAPVLVAANTPIPPVPKPVTRPARLQPQQPTNPAPVAVALATPPDETPPKFEPKLVAAPRAVERTSRFRPGPSVADRTQLDKLVTLAALEKTAPPPRLVTAPAPAARPQRSAVTAPPAAPPAAPRAIPEEGDGAGALGSGTRWAQAPAYDDDHPEELSYRPFPLGPMLTASASLDDPAFTQLVHPDLAKTFEIIDDVGAILPMRLRPRLQVAELMWSQQFRGGAVQVPAAASDETGAAPQGIANRAVKTSAR